MEKEMQDYVWAILPNGFKKEVKEAYKTPYNSIHDGGYNHALEYFFGIDNLTSDTETEEMLIVPRSEIVDRYHALIQAQEGYSAPQRRANILLLQQLFGKKCMPDESNSEPKFKVGDLVTVHLLNGESLTGNIYEVMADSSYDVRMVDGSMMHSVKCERISPYNEKKFLVGDKVLISDDPRIGKDFRGRIGTVVFICSSDKRIVDVGNGVIPEYFHISHLTPYTKPKYKVGDKIRVTNIVPEKYAGSVGVVKSFSKGFYNTELLDGGGVMSREEDLEPYGNDLLSENEENENNGNHIVGSENKQLRIMVAAEAMKGLLANTNIIMSCGDLEDNQEYITKHAVEYADALIKGINGKGGGDELGR